MISKVVLFLGVLGLVSAATLGESCSADSDCVSSQSKSRSKTRTVAVNKGMKGQDDNEMCCGTNIFDPSGASVCTHRMLEGMIVGQTTIKCTTSKDDGMLCSSDSDCTAYVNSKTGSSGSSGSGNKRSSNKGKKGSSSSSSSGPTMLCSSVSMTVTSDSQTAEITGSKCMPDDKCNMAAPYTKEMDSASVEFQSTCSSSTVFDPSQYMNKDGKGGCSSDSDCDADQCCGSHDGKNMCIQSSWNGLTLTYGDTKKTLQCLSNPQSECTKSSDCQSGKTCAKISGSFMKPTQDDEAPMRLMAKKPKSDSKDRSGKGGKGGKGGQSGNLEEVSATGTICVSSCSDKLNIPTSKGITLKCN